jgi:hypothetical protein
MQTDDDDEVCSDGMCYFSCSMDDDESKGGCDDTPNKPAELALFSHILTDESI